MVPSDSLGNDDPLREKAGVYRPGPIAVAAMGLTPEYLEQDLKTFGFILSVSASGT